MTTKTEELTQFLRSRRSIRRFTGDPVPDEILRDILQTAVHAPSAHNLQPWRFVIVESGPARNTLGQALTGRMTRDMQTENAPQTEIDNRVEGSLRRITAAPAVILLCRAADAVRADQPEEDLMGIQSVAAAGLQLLLAAHAHNLGGNWICWPLYAQEETVRSLGLPANWQPQGMVFLGYPAEQAREKALKPLEDVLMTVDGGR
jgi:coenzyme F420-0:L-glutamate ligase / coenzyme F420-1:gamma-L-glutamate ligase